MARDPIPPAPAGRRHRRRPARAGPAGRAAVPTAGEAFAALDLGTNNCRLLVAEPAEDGYRVIDAFSRVVRLGEGLERTGVLSREAMTRTIGALKQCGQRIRRRRVAASRSVATEACRRAGNGAEFLARVRDETGIALEVITPEEEAALAMAGCVSLLADDKPFAVLFDIGGGSTEVLWIGRGEDGAARLEDCLSLPFGVVTLSERYDGSRLDGDTYALIRDATHGALQAFEDRHRIAARAASGEVQLIGTSGTVTTIAGVHMRLERYDRRRIDGATIGRATVAAAVATLRDMGHDRRAAHPCIGAARADLVVPGCAVLEGICARVPVADLTVADRGVRDGILLGLMGRATPPPGIGAAR